MYSNNCEFDSLLFPNNRTNKLTSFVTVLIPVDLEAQDRHADPISAWRRFFCEAIMFFVHVYEGNVMYFFKVLIHSSDIS